MPVASPPALDAGRPRATARAVTRARVAVPLGLALLLGLSVFVRTTELRLGYWVDEGLSVGIADRPLTDIPGTLRLDGSPPLYYLVLHAWMAIAGDSETATHIVSLICAVLVVPVAFWAVDAAFGRRTAWVTAVLAALNPFLTTYAQETRMYALVVLLGMAATGLFLRAYTVAEARGRRLPVAFGLVLAAMLYTHNWALFFGASLFVAFLVLVALAPEEERRRRIRAGMLGFGLTAVLYLPWIPTLLFQAAHTGAPWSRRPDWSNLAEGVPHRLLGTNGWLTLAVGACAGIALLMRTRGARRLSREARALVVVAIATVGTVLLAFASSQLSPAWADRYLAVAVAPALIIVGAGLAAARGAGLAALVAVALLWYHDEPPSLKSNVREVATAIGPSLSPGDVVVSTQPEQVAVLSHYLPAGLRYATPTGYVHDLGVTDWRDGVERLQAATPQRDLEPILDAVAPGHRLVLIVPIIFDLGRWRAPWTRLVRIRSDEWKQFIVNDARFRATTIYPPEPGARRPNPVAATVLLKMRR